MSDTTEARPDHLAPFFIGVDRLRQFVREAADLARKMTDDRPKSLAPSLSVLTAEKPGGEEKVMVFALYVPFNEHDEKHNLLLNLGRQVYGLRTFPLAAVLTSEAWVARDSDVEPRHNPERRENVVVAGLGLDRKTSVLMTAEVTRGEHGGMVVGEFGEKEGASFPLVDRFYQGFFAAFREWAQSKGIEL